VKPYAFVSCLLAAAAALGALQSSGVDPSAVPVDQEPRHRVVFRNQFVRVIDAAFPPLYVSTYHTHLADNVAITIVPGRDDAQGQARIGFAGFSRGGYSHVITNPANAPMRFIDVELLSADRAAAFGDPAPANHTAVLSNSRVRIWRVRLDAGQSLTDHLHGGGYAAVTVRGGDGPGTWRWHGSSEGALPLRAGRQLLEVVEVEPR
jgi:hypothetical protein